MSNFLNQFAEKFKNYIDDNLMTTNEMQTKVIAYLNTQEVKDHIIEQYLEDLELNEKFRMEVEVSSGQVFTMWGVDNSSYTYDGTIDWGDGTVETFTTYNPSHTYTTAGIYEIAISGRFDTLYDVSGSNTSVQSVRKILSWGDGTVFEGFRNLSNSFFYAAGLTEIASDTYGGLSNNMNFYYCFGHCHSLTAIPADLFDNCTNVTDFYGCFYYCNSLTAIPVGLFDNCTNVTSFNRCFYSCCSLTAIPVGLFDNCPNVTDFNFCFCYCNSLTAIPAGLFDNCPNVTDFNFCFYSCSSLTAIPAGLFDNCPNVTSFSSCFYSCSSLTAIPAGLFDSCTAVTSFAYCFYSCSSLTEIPAGLFDNCPNVTSFNSCFKDCNSLILTSDLFDINLLKDRMINFNSCFYVVGTNSVGTAPELWDAGLLSGSTYVDCFQGRTSLSNYGSIPANWK